MTNIYGKKENLELFNKEGKRIYGFYTDLDGYSHEITCDDKGNVLTCKNSNGFSSEFTYDSLGNTLTYKNSDGVYQIKGNSVTKQEYENFINTPKYTMEELFKIVGHNFEIKK